MKRIGAPLKEEADDADEAKFAREAERGASIVGVQMFVGAAAEEQLVRQVHHRGG